MSGMEWATWATAFGSFLAIVTLIYVEVFLPWWRRPRFEVIFENEEPWCRRSVGSSWIRLEIKNVGKSVAKECVGKLMEVRSSDQEREPKFEPTALHWVSKPMDVVPRLMPPSEFFDEVSDERIDINSGDSEFLDVVRASDFGNSMNICPADRRSRSIKWDYEPAEYYFKITILGENVEPISRDFHVTWTGDHNDLRMDPVN